jgi:hypothetical protein
VATQLLARGATLSDLAQVEHAYSPAYAPAIDPLAVAAFAAQNQDDGIAAEAPVSPLVEVTDVRWPAERRRRPVPAAVVHEVTVSGLRSGAEACLQAEGTVVCEQGGRAAEAVRLIRASGRQASYLGGGLLWREAAQRKRSRDERPPSGDEVGAVSRRGSGAP